MAELIFSQVPIDELVDRLIARLEANLTKPVIPTLQDEMGIDETASITGYKKSKLYRDSMNGTVPCSKRGKKLVFSRREIQEWMRVNTLRKSGISQRVKSALINE